MGVGYIAGIVLWHAYQRGGLTTCKAILCRFACRDGPPVWLFARGDTFLLTFQSVERVPFFCGLQKEENLWRKH